MTPKRKNEEVDESTAREKKRRKIAVARTIAVQPATPNVGRQNAAAGSSKSVTLDSKYSSMSHCLQR